MNENKKININEKITITDKAGTSEKKPPIIGVIRLYDENNNLIIEKHNTVVFTGRKLLLKLFRTFFEKTFHDSNYKQFGMLYLNLSYKTPYIQTTNDMQFTDVSKDETNKWKTQIIDIAINETELSCKFSADIASSDIFNKFNQVYLSFQESTSEGRTEQSTENQLFSRVSLDPIFLGSNGSYKLDYTLYF